MILSIIIPVYNEEDTLEEIVSRVSGVNLQAGLTKEIIIVDDASTDSSKIKSQKLKLKMKNLKTISHTVNKGKGAAVRTGLKNSIGDIVLVQDADLEYDPNDYSRLIEPILSGRVNVVYGTRLKNYPVKIFGKKHTPFLTHYLGNKFLSLATRLLYGSKITDMETCYKVFSKKVIKNIKIRSNRFEFEPEVTAKILKAGYKIYEVPIKVNPRGYDEGKKITWIDGFLAIWTLIKYRFSN